MSLPAWCPRPALNGATATPARGRCLEMGSRRTSSRARTPPATMLRTTSLTPHPCVRATRLAADRSSRRIASRRSGPTGALSELTGACRAIELTTRKDRATRATCRHVAGRASHSADSIVSLTLSSTRATDRGGGSGTGASPARGPAGDIGGSSSERTMRIAAWPSARAWWRMTSTLARPPSSPVRNHIRHSGRERSRGAARSRSVSASRAASLPGGGTRPRSVDGRSRSGDRPPRSLDRGGDPVEARLGAARARPRPGHRARGGCREAEAPRGVRQRNAVDHDEDADVDRPRRRLDREAVQVVRAQPADRGPGRRACPAPR